MLPLPYMVTGESHWCMYNRTLLSLGWSVSGGWLCRVTVILWHETFPTSAICNLHVIMVQSYHHCVITVASIGIHRIHRIWFQGSITVFELESVCVLKKGNVTYIFMSKTQEFSQPAATVNGWMMGSMRFRRGGQIVPAPQWIRSRHR